MSDEILAILNEQSKTLGRLESSLELLVGNGQPGLIKEMRDDISSLKETRANAKGYIGGVSAAIVAGEGLFHYLLHKLGVK